MVERKLASIQRIVDLQDIPNADAIQCATVLGWHCVVKKGEFKVGDLCIYFEIDSLLPIHPAFSFLEERGRKKMFFEGKEYEGYRLRTVKLRGQISQGLCLPISILGEEIKDSIVSGNGEKRTIEDMVGTDVSSYLSVIKYEPPIPSELSGIVKGIFPSSIPKTDEERIQSSPSILNKYKEQFYVTEKVDGASCTLFLGDDGKLNVCSRNLNLLETKDNSMWKVARETDIEKKLTEYGPTISLQGEIVGSNIQGNKLKLNGHRILYFSAYDYKNGRYLNLDEFIAFCNKCNIPTVPLINDAYTLPESVDELVRFATRKSAIASDVWAEGIVVRPLKEIHDQDLGRLSFKVINPEFLLKYGE